MKYQFEGTTEGAIQQKCYTWYVENFPHLRNLLQSIPNESKRSASYGNKLKAMGLTPGFPDMAFHFRGRTAFLEFKDKKGDLSPAQRAVKHDLERQGFVVYICRDLVSFQRALMDCFGGSIWRDLMSVPPEGRIIRSEALIGIAPDWQPVGPPPEQVLPDAVFDETKHTPKVEEVPEDVKEEMTNPEGLDENPWDGITGLRDIDKLKADDARALAAQLALDSSGQAKVIKKRIKALWKDHVVAMKAKAAEDAKLAEQNKNEVSQVKGGDAGDRGLKPGAAEAPPIKVRLPGPDDAPESPWDAADEAQREAVLESLDIDDIPVDKSWAEVMAMLAQDAETALAIADAFPK